MNVVVEVVVMVIVRRDYEDSEYNEKQPEFA